MSRRRAFSLFELVIVIVIMGVLASTSFCFYKTFIEKSKSSEAIVNIGAITDAEEFHKLENDIYVAAENLDEINRLLGLDIIAKYYEYKVVGVTDDNFIVIATRIGEDIDAYLSSGILPPGSMVIALDKFGTPQTDYASYLGSGQGSSSGGSSGGGSSGGDSGGSGGGSGGSGGGSTTSTTTGGSTGGTVSAGYVRVVDADLGSALDLLRETATGSYYATLIDEEQISLIFDDFSKYAGMETADGFWWGIQNNTIYINQKMETSSESELAALIAHEATHADYSYNPQKWIDSTLTQHPELTLADLHITVYPGDSIDQEYNAYVNEVLVWKELRVINNGTNGNMGWEFYYDLGEAAMKGEIMSLGLYQGYPLY